ncbi:MAG TPA: glycerophosphoryl diester phosphodiesterase [Patescibacteria group bacterium]|nr:glycerophosphoryl diester phosphodiesterase [Patescibacteria group bacterium]
MSQLILPRVIGHRGIAASAPENTLAGFRCAAAQGVAMVELDVQLTSDGVPVVFHDDALERTTDGQGLLCETPLAVLRRCDAGAWFGPGFAGEMVPTLAEAITVIVELGLGLNIEVKADEDRGAATAQTALAVVRSQWPAGRPAPLLSSFSRSALRAVAEMMPDWPRGLLVGALPDDWAKAVQSLGCVAVHADHRRLNPRRVHAVKDAGVLLLAYTVNRADHADRLWSWGVDAVFSDHPERLGHPLFQPELE